ncbi:MAG: hypothetical protein ACLR5H_03820 [Oscillospiraceae bacterium]
MDFGIAGVAAITVIAYAVGQAMRAWGRGERWIPTVCAVLGGALGKWRDCISCRASRRGTPSPPPPSAWCRSLAATGAQQAVKRLCTGPDCGREVSFAGGKRAAFAPSPASKKP